MKMSSLSKNLHIDVAFSFLHSIFRTFYIVWQYKIEGEARALTAWESGIFIYSGSAWLISFKIENRLISKKLEHEHINNTATPH